MVARAMAPDVMGTGTDTEVMGMRLAMGRLLRRRTSLVPALPRSGRPRLLGDERSLGDEKRSEGTAGDVDVRCTACALCMAACPSACIHVEAGPRPGTLAGSGDRMASMFEIDLGRCVLCGLCAQACPVDAIRLDGALPSWAPNRAALHLDLDALKRI